jgi:hypothetical protein
MPGRNPPLRQARGPNAPAFRESRHPWATPQPAEKLTFINSVSFRCREDILTGAKGNPETSARQARSSPRSAPAFRGGSERERTAADKWLNDCQIEWLPRGVAPSLGCERTPGSKGIGGPSAVAPTGKNEEPIPPHRLRYRIIIRGNDEDARFYFLAPTARMRPASWRRFRQR